MQAYLAELRERSIHFDLHLAEPGQLAHRGDETPQRRGPERGGRVTN